MMKNLIAYGITVHKSQGSDFNNVFLVIPEKYGLLTKELIYTALTRSKNKLFLFIYKAEENLLEKARGYSDLLTRQTSIFLPPDENRIKYYPHGGEKPVKSKGEFIIHEALGRSGFNFKYENLLELKDKQYNIHPDFTIIRKGKKNVYWEHLGMLDTRKYLHDWQQRIEDYKNLKIFDQVITTDDLEGINAEIIEKIIDDIREDKIINTSDNQFSLHHYQLYK